MNDKQYAAILMTLGRKLTSHQISPQDYEERLTTIMAAYKAAKEAAAENLRIAETAAQQ